MFGSKLKKDKKILDKLYDKKYAIEDRCEKHPSSENEASLDDIIKEINDFVEQVYAKDVFEHYYKKRPDLIRVKTGEVVDWETAFGNDFEKISKSLRHSLAGLPEGEGRYKLAR